MERWCSLMNKKCSRTKKILNGAEIDPKWSLALIWKKIMLKIFQKWVLDKQLEGIFCEFLYILKSLKEHMRIYLHNYYFLLQDSRSEIFLPLPTGERETRRRKMKISVGLLFSGSEVLNKLILDASNFIEELTQRIRFQVSKCVLDRKTAFVHNMFNLYTQIYETVIVFMTTQRMHLTAWHLSSSYQNFLAQQFVRLKNQLDTKETNFFLRWAGVSVLTVYKLCFVQSGFVLRELVIVTRSKYWHF